MAGETISGMARRGGEGNRSSSKEKASEGLDFHSETYPTYQEMVNSKRERNCKILEWTSNNISSVLGSD